MQHWVETVFWLIVYWCLNCWWWWWGVSSWDAALQRSAFFQTRGFVISDSRLAALSAPSASQTGQQQQQQGPAVSTVARGLPWFGGLGEAFSRVKGGVTRWGEGCSYQFSWACLPSAKVRDADWQKYLLRLGSKIFWSKHNFVQIGFKQWVQCRQKAKGYLNNKGSDSIPQVNWVEVTPLQLRKNWEKNSQGILWG